MPGIHTERMRGANGQYPSPKRRTTAERASPAYSAEERETLRRGLRIIARIIARAHLRRKEPGQTAKGEDGD